MEKDLGEKDHHGSKNCSMWYPKTTTELFSTSIKTASIRTEKTIEEEEFLK